MDKEMITHKEFSPGFQHDIADLLELCVDNKTDNITIDLDYPTATLEVELTFRIHPKGSN
jgi:hypothetical protein